MVGGRSSCCSSRGWKVPIISSTSVEYVNLNSRAPASAPAKPTVDKLKTKKKQEEGEGEKVKIVHHGMKTILVWVTK